MARRRVEVATSRPAGVPCCDVCLRPTPTAARTEAGVRHCRVCYKLRFARRVCTTCGRLATIARADAVATCRACRDDGRRCVRCGRPAPKAGRVVPGGVACRSCAYHYVPKRECVRCGRPAPRLSRVGGGDEPVCDGCRRAATCATCSRCGRHRRAAGRDDAGRPVCGPCGSGASHACPDCGRDVPGAGTAPCRPCSARRRGRTRAAERRTGLAPWVGPVFDAFCADRLLGASPHGAVVDRVDRAADFLAAVGDAFASPAEVDAATLLKRFGAARLRRAEAATAFLLDRLGRVWDVADPDVASPVGPEAAPGTAAALLADYRRHLQARGDRRTKPRTIRAYMDAARVLMAFAEADGRTLPTTRDVRRLLWRTPGARASLGPFLRWIEVTRAVRVALPRRAPVDRRSVERRRLRELSTLVRALEAAPTEAPSRPALLAACLSRAFGAPLGTVLNLRVEQIDAWECHTLRLDGLRVDMPARLASPLQVMLGERSSGLAFPGRSAIKPLSTAAVWHHVRAVIGSRPRRASRFLTPRR